MYPKKLEDLAKTRTLFIDIADTLLSVSLYQIDG